MKSTIHSLLLASVAVFAIGSADSAAAATFNFQMSGWLTPGTTLAGSTITADTPFSVTARFDTSANLVSFLPFPGFVAYTPSYVSLTSGGQTYAIQPYDPTTHLGFSVAIFDGTTPFGPPGHYAAGLIQDPVADGAGIVGDWLTATPGYAAANLVSTTFTAANFFGVGFGSGVCLSNCQMPGEVDAVTPVPLTFNGMSSTLVLPSTDLTYAGFQAPGPSTDKQWTASLTAVPEPAAWSFMLVGFGLAGLAARRRRSLQAIA